jgi:Phosphotransferase enzyme family
METRVTPAEALNDACAQTGLDATGACVIYERSNAVFRLAHDPVVVRLRYAPGSAEWMDRLTASVRVTAWLRTRQFPAVRPLDVGQPVAVGGYLVTFWDYVPEVGPPRNDIGALARLLRQLHRLPAPPVELPVTNPLGSLREDMARCAWLSKSQRSWLASRCDDLERQYDQASWKLGRGLLHGDAYTGNLLHTRDGAVLADWDSVSRGPREQDLVATRMRCRFGEPAAQWDQFCDAYGLDPALPGLPVLQQMCELRALAAYLRSPRPAAQVEATRRIIDLITGTQGRPWTGLNLAS